MVDTGLKKVQSCLSGSIELAGSFDSVLMVDVNRKPNGDQSSIPIPTYEETIASHPSSSTSFLGPTETSHDAERQTIFSLQRLLQQETESHSARPSMHDLDYLPSSEENTPRNSTDALRREMGQMDVIDPEPNEHSSTTIAGRLSKRINNLTHGFSSINVSFRQWLPSRDGLRARIPSLPEQLRPQWMIVVRIFALMLVLFVVYLLFLSDIFTVDRGRGTDQLYDPEFPRSYAQTYINKDNIRQNLEHVTSFDHVAGTEGSFVLGRWVESLFRAAGLEHVSLERFDVYLNYPRANGRRVAIIEPPGLAWKAELEEQPAYREPPRAQSFVFHGHSKSGNVTGPLIYANYGSKKDFQKLQDEGIDFTGSIVLVRYYGTQGDRALKVKAAELAGAVGCIIYSDPAEDGFKKGKPYPDGRYMPSDGVQRGAVSLMSWIVGDVLSKGFSSLPGEKRRDSKESNPGLTNIPSIPLAWRDAQKLLQALKGHGRRVADDWIGGVENVEWWSGDQGSPVVHLMNEQDEIERQPIYNIIGQITGLEQPEKSIFVGNHRDAWCFGAADPGSGTAILMEIVRIFGELRDLGWRPLRTIKFASWDGEEYNLIGSTEHVEQRIEDIRRNGVAYLNVDVAVSGRDFSASASPLFEKALLQVLDRTSDLTKNETLRSIWDKRKDKLQGLGARSGYVAFQDLAGTSSIDIGFHGPPYPYHSCYDNLEWMKKYGDPDFEYHKTLAQVWALLILEMADTRLIPFDFIAYAHAIHTYVKELETYVSNRSSSPRKLKLKPLYDSVKDLSENAHRFQEWDRIWAETVYSQGGYEPNVIAMQRISHNTRMADFETNLLDIDGGVSFFFLSLHPLF